MSMKIDSKSKKFCKIPTLSLPIKILETVSEWFEKDKKLTSRILKYPFYALLLSLGMLITTVTICIDFLICIFASLISLVHGSEQVKFKQTAWNCFICASMGGIHTLIKTAKKIIYPIKK